MPERALLKLQRARIPIFRIQKEKKDELSFWVREQDAHKIRTLYGRGLGAYTLQDCGAKGAQKWVAFLKNRVCFLLGALLFCGASLYMQSFVFGVEIVGAKAYEREVLQVLNENGVKAFYPYQKEKEDFICAQLLTLKNVEFCSVKKSGAKVIVELRTNIFQEPHLQNSHSKGFVHNPY